MPWSTSTRRASLPPDWAHRVALVRGRARGRCERVLEDGTRCDRPGRDVDHHVHRDDHRVDSLRLLCGPHHDEKTAAEAAAGRRLTSKRRQPEPHPGLLP